MSDQQFQEYLKANSHLSERSIIQYNNQFLKFESMPKNLVTQSQANIISFVDDTSFSENTKLAMLNISINVRKHFKKDVNKMNTRKLQLADDYQQQKNAIKKEKQTDLPSSKELIAWENRQYLDGNWNGFIIVHLMRVLSLRNKDLDLKIIPANRSQRKGQAGDKNNYLILRKNNAQLVRNDYKTYKQYGQKKNILQSRKLNKAIRELIAERDLILGKDEIRLLSTKGGKKMNEESIAKKIRSFTFRGLSETDYNKVFVSEIAEVKDLNKIKKVADNRGTSVYVILSEYHIDVEL